MRAGVLMMIMMMRTLNRFQMFQRMLFVRMFQMFQMFQRMLLMHELCKMLALTLFPTMRPNSLVGKTPSFCCLVGLTSLVMKP